MARLPSGEGSSCHSFPFNPLFANKKLDYKTTLEIRSRLANGGFSVTSNVLPRHQFFAIATFDLLTIFLMSLTLIWRTETGGAQRVDAAITMIRPYLEMGLDVVDRSIKAVIGFPTGTSVLFMQRTHAGIG